MRKIIIIILILLIGTFFYAKYIGTTGLTVKDYYVKSEKITDNFNSYKILHFSDTLISDEDDLKELQLVVDKINEINPDLLVFTGNLLKEKIDFEDDLIEILKKINVKNIYAIEDNESAIEILENANFKVINDECLNIFHIDNTPILLCGYNSLDNELIQNKNYSFLITLISKPDDFDNYTNSDLVLAGYSLGGSIRLPFIGGLIYEKGALKYKDDYYNHDDSLMYVNYGIGTKKYEYRLFNKPSLNLYRLMTK